jgi:peptidoglycan/xylan/chitin deacetylase (PgdA/CDA1 family)
METWTVPDAGRPVFLLGVDTEADDQWSLEGRKRLSVANAACLPRLQALCDRLGVRPTFLVTHEMATKQESSDVLKSLLAAGRCEIGAHLHPWSSPPYREDDLAGTYPSQLPDDLLERQMRELTDALASQFGSRPTTYRAGRLGFDGRGLRRLEALGYLVDSSVDPLANEARLGGPRFAGAPVSPYHPDHADVRRPGASPILEVPVTSATLPPLPKAFERIYASLPPRRYRGPLKRLGLRPVWLRPSYSPAGDAIALADRLVARGVPTLNMLFHSSELLPGGSPYHRDATAVERFYETFRRVVDHIIGRLGAAGLTYAEYAASRGGAAPGHPRHG